MTVGHHVGIGEGFLGRLVRMRHHVAVGHEQRHPFRGRLLLHPRQQPGAKGLPIVPGLVGEPGDLEELVEQVRQQVAELQPAAVLALHRVIVDGGQDVCRWRRCGQAEPVATAKLGISSPAAGRP